jgi:hypothetical protein
MAIRSVGAPYFGFWIRFDSLIHEWRCIDRSSIDRTLPVPVPVQVQVIKSGIHSITTQSIILTGWYTVDDTVKQISETN